VLSTQEIQNKYQRQAKHYDFSVQLYRLIGLRIEAYRLRAVQLLHLQRGDFVVELGCGTGLNFPHLVERIGSEGRLIGVDLTSEMLECAQERVERSGWTNVELVQSDIATYDFPEVINGVLSTGTFGYVTEYERVIEKASHALVPGGRLVIMDGKRSERCPLWLFKLFVWLSRPFGVTPDYFDGHPCWESVERFFKEAELEEMYGGLMYISSGTAA
jgi:demethylmenaquinone methyltransferase/2-methoxy-6-polyprenyl-1,4-benzoquinol methylase